MIVTKCFYVCSKSDSHVCLETDGRTIFLRDGDNEDNYMSHLEVDVEDMRKIMQEADAINAGEDE